MLTMRTMLTMLTQWPLESPQRPSGLDALRRSLQGIDWEAIFVDDDSQDGTPDAVCGLGTAEYVASNGLAAAGSRLRLGVLADGTASYSHSP
jgi:hypothetical protein